MKRLSVIVFWVLLMWVNSAYCQELTVNEWDSLSNYGWSAGGGSDGTGPTIVSAPDAPTGSNVLRFQYAEGSADPWPGKAEYFFPKPMEEYYVGHWFKYSSDYVPYEVANKIHYSFTDEQVCGHTTNYYVGFLGSARRMYFCLQGIYPGAGGQCEAVTENYYAGDRAGEMDYRPEIGKWHWIETYVKMNDKYGEGNWNGVVKVWLDGNLIINMNNVALRYGPGKGYVTFEHTPLGAGGRPLSHDMFFYVDHTVLSTQRIGMPGGADADTTPPAAPTGLVVVE